MTDWTIQTRGERNNNPGNVRRSGAAWQGKIDGKDTAFETFESPFWGIRALARVLLTYHDRYGLLTIREIVGRWAPPNENDTDAYVDAVARDLLTEEDKRLALSSVHVLKDLTKAIIKHENGRVMYSDALILAACLKAY